MKFSVEIKWEAALHRIEALGCITLASNSIGV